MKGYTSPKGVSASTETLAGESDLFTFIKEALGPIDRKKSFERVAGKTSNAVSGISPRRTI